MIDTQYKRSAVAWVLSVTVHVAAFLAFGTVLVESARYALMSDVDRLAMLQSRQQTLELIIWQETAALPPPVATRDPYPVEPEPEVETASKEPQPAERLAVMPAEPVELVESESTEVESDANVTEVEPPPKSSMQREEAHMPRPEQAVASEQRRKIEGTAPAESEPAPVAAESQTTWQETPASFRDATALPDYERNPPPRYPATARRRGWEGLVLLEVRINKRGGVDSLRIQQSSGYTVLDDSAVKAVREWRFLPARVAGIAIESRAEVPIRFQLE